MKPSHYLMLLIVLVLGLYALADRTADVVNGPVPADAQRDTLRKRIVRVLANWLIDRNMRQPAPTEADSLDAERTRSLAQQPAYLSHPPAIPPSQLLSSRDAPLDHRHGW